MWLASVMLGILLFAFMVVYPKNYLTVSQSSQGPRSRELHINIITESGMKSVEKFVFLSFHESQLII